MDGRNVVPDVHEVLNKIKDFSGALTCGLVGGCLIERVLLHDKNILCGKIYPCICCLAFPPSCLLLTK